ncbi:glutathione peroxidase [Paenibacillus albicereus]|uniref:Glutathione peroxidase n=1 Tax=Paenibacillus albicereus TaxID=2726185 RepID=A0A6H2GYH1_9BACL|nr:glutathione peroxidase [Paenibacillus albicereus]QJC52455.1 glutathione peroxidase [Paenibacillus albicereus]
MSIYEIPVQKASGESVTLEPYRGKVMLIVNTATKCGLAPQFDGLEKLHQTYKDEGLAVLGFPCGQFANQEPGGNDQIQEACRINFGVTFPLYAKVDVNGDGAHPLFRHLTSEAKGFLGTKAIKWNFTKFLVDKDGRVVQRFAPTDKPEKIESHIRRLLGAGAAV